MGSSPAFLLQRQQNWHFKQTDDLVKYYLDQADINAVRRWQTLDGYTFEFHEGHETGNPIYIRPDGNTSQQSMPKVDTKNIVNPALHYKNSKKPNDPWLENIANYEVLSASLTTQQLAEIAAIFVDNWSALQKVADRRWNNYKPAGQGVQAAGIGWVAKLKCQSALCRNRTILLAISSLGAAQYIPLQSVGKCKSCRQSNWAFVEARALAPGETPDIPLSAEPNPNRSI